eukprot:scaffold62277_cov68-Phaeocystis_antarctica.AAC.2
MVRSRGDIRAGVDVQVRVDLHGGHARAQHLHAHADAACRHTLADAADDAAGHHDELGRRAALGAAHRERPRGEACAAGGRRKAHRERPRGDAQVGTRVDERLARER